MNNPQSLNELRSLSREQMLCIDDYRHRGGLSIKALIRDFIRLANRELEWQGRENALSLRGFWYSGIKQILETAFPDKLDDPSYDFARRMPQRLSDVLSEMVKDGEITYRELNILDDSRQRQTMVDTIEDDKILFVEKDAAYRHLTPLSDVYEFTVVSGSGWQSTALIEDLSATLEDQPYEFYILGDYDPTGFRIVEDFEQRCRRLGITVKRAERIGINPDQVDDDTLGSELFTPPVRNDYDERWMNEYAIDGQYGLEIEAIGELQTAAQDLREIVLRELVEEFDIERRRERDTNISTANMARRVPDSMADRIVEDIRVALIKHAVDILTDREPANHVRYAEDTDTIYANIDLEQAEDGDELIPTPYSPDELFDSAVSPTFTDDGKALPAYPSDGEQSTELERRLKQLIDDGEIDLESLIDL